MSIISERRYNLLSIEDKLWLMTAPVNVGNYDFAFEQYFTCRHLWQRPEKITTVARIGVVKEYAELYAALENEGVQLIHTPEEYQKCSELPYWYPSLKDLTPRSIWFDEHPSVEQITQEFQLPIFIKGARQTSKHKRSLSIIENREALATALQAYQHNPILHWQSLVCRDYVMLRSVGKSDGEEIPSSFEFRTFWWKQPFVGAGRYWVNAPAYKWTASEEHDALAIARQAAQQLNVPFLVVDVAQCVDGQWIVVEVNDAQESGYADVSPFQLWRNILTIEAKS
jgi:hypothetical protein